MDENLGAEQISKFCGKSFNDVRSIEGYVCCEASKCLNVDRGKKCKKTWWVTSNGKDKGVSCNQCGKGFKSLKALFGHMRLHSKRKLGIQKEGVKVPNMARKKRSKMRLKNTNNSSLSNVDEELQDIAACLLTLAKGGFYTSDEIASDNKCLMVGPNFRVESTIQKSYDDGHCDEGPVIGVNSCDVESGHFSFMDKMVESSSSHCKSLRFEPKNGGMETPFIEDIDTVCDKMNTKTPVEGILLKEQKKNKCNVAIHSHQFDCPTSCECHHLKPTACVETKGETDILFCGKDENEAKPRGRNRTKIWKMYQCLVCFKAFSSGQALGGHMRTHFHGKCISKEKEGLALNECVTSCHGSVDASEFEIPAVHEQEALELSNI